MSIFLGRKENGSNYWFLKCTMCFDEKNIHTITFFQIMRNLLKFINFEQWMNLKLLMVTHLMRKTRDFLCHRSIMGCIKLGWCCFINSYYSRPIQQLVTHTNILPKLFVSNCLQTVVFLCVNLINKNIQGQSWWSLSWLYLFRK